MNVWWTEEELESLSPEEMEGLRLDLLEARASTERDETAEFLDHVLLTIETIKEARQLRLP